MSSVITPLELAAELRGENPPVLLDVREANEVAHTSLAPGAHAESDGPRAQTFVHIPLSTLEFKVKKLNKDDNIVVVCRSGARSQRATDFLLSQGFSNVRNLVTGMIGWVETVEPGIPHPNS